MKRVFLVTLLVVLAGCSALPGATGTAETPRVTDGDGGGTDSTPGPQATETASRPTTAGATATAETTSMTRNSPETTPTPDIDPADTPWGVDTVTVALVSEGDGEIDYRTPLSDALDYWNTNAQYGDYTVEFVTVDDADDADVHVEIRDSVDSCGIEQGERVLGCAPLLTEDTTADPPAEVLIESGYDTASTEEIMIHEFGHVLGIRHGEDPEQYMQPTETVNRTARPNASERGYPWETTDFRVFAATEDLRASDRADAREQVGHVIDYYERIKDEDDDVPENVTIVRVDNRSDANVVVEFPDRLRHGETERSSLARFGSDTDGDGAIEYYTNATIALADIDTEAVGWHTGYWFGQALGLAERDLPAPFRNADASDRRDEWWTESP
ncbi:matrixin family metalloprotease [Halorientalis salina]|uniref:matrixin family metalloprotease n=1 Tax=Halorientalis salina TaxID=2932266 RepID=UPI0010AC8A8A|nr:matrixin family metalloprotease [Halorientalis salina]